MCQFTDRFIIKKKEPSGRHLFDRGSQQFKIEHRLIPPRHPQTNGMPERFNGRVSEIVNQARFSSAQLPKNLQPQHSAARIETSNADSSAEEMAARKAEIFCQVLRGIPSSPNTQRIRTYVPIDINGLSDRLDNLIWSCPRQPSLAK